jgi:putative nucleotidyltransferase with HDIG domain
VNISNLQRQYQEQKEYLECLTSMMLTINTEYTDMLMDTIDAKDHYTMKHSSRVSKFSVQIGRLCGVPLTELEALRRAAQIHDIGKIRIPEGILLKQDKLTPEEMLIVKQHPINGARIVSKVKTLRRAVDVVLYHHERWDGNGYPEGKKGEETPLWPRIVGIADAIDSMSTPRPYRGAKTEEWICQELQEHAGRQFDPRIIGKILTPGSGFRFKIKGKVK